MPSVFMLTRKQIFTRWVSHFSASAPVNREARTLPRFLADESAGSALIELAVAIPIMLLLAIGIVDYARVYFTGITVANAAEAGAHYGAWKNGDPAEMKYYAQADAGSVTLDTVTAGQYCICPGQGLVSCSSGPCAGSTYGLPQVYDSVRVRKDVTLFIHYLGFPSKVTVARTAVLREK